MVGFQSTHPHGVRHIYYYYKISSICFNPRTHTGCDGFVAGKGTKPKSFNPRTHTGCDEDSGREPTGARGVSIHAPTRGATASPLLNSIKKRSLFQSTHPHGVRHRGYPRTMRCLGFQSTHPHGVRLTDYLNYGQIWLVSIHAPTRGATFLFATNRESMGVWCFNPRTHTGCD